MEPTAAWQVTLDDLGERRAASYAMGGDERLARHRAAGKLTARARVDYAPRLRQLQGARHVGRWQVPADAIVAGSGHIDGRPVMVGAEDFTVVAGTIGPISNAKRFRLAEHALQQRIPLIMILEGAGFRPTDHGPRSIANRPAHAGPAAPARIPVITAVLGPPPAMAR